MNILLQLLTLLRLQGISRQIEAQKPRPMPEIDLSPELYEHREPQGPPPPVEENPCARIISDEDMIIRQLEIRFNKAPESR